MPPQPVLAVDVGTGSVRAALFSPADGSRLSATHVVATKTRAARANHFEQSSADIWAAVVGVVRAVLSDAGPSAAEIVSGIAFDATCSLVAVAASDGSPISVVEGGDDDENEFDVVLWCDHRAVAEADAINAVQSEDVDAVRRHFGGKLSAENQPPKLLHLQNHMPRFADAVFFDLSDWLSWRCLGGPATAAPRSSCTLACKWGWGGLASPSWSLAFWRDIGLGRLVDGGCERIGPEVFAPGARIGTLCHSAATELGLGDRVCVAAGMIDAHAGALGMLGARGIEDRAPRVQDRFAMICGTSTCHIVITPQPVFVDGVWGPFRDAVFAGAWCAEGGQSATGAFVDNLITRAAASEGLVKEAEARGVTVYDVLEERAVGVDTTHVHILPYANGNRSPRADPTLREVVSGLGLIPSAEQAEAELVAVYKASVQSLALGARHIVVRLEEGGHKLSAIIACGSQAKSKLFRHALADACKLPVMAAREEDSVLCGTAILAAAAAASSAGTTANGVSLLEYAKEMSAVDDAATIEPCRANFDFMDRKFKVFLRMCDDYLDYRTIMGDGSI